jgi:hypothetical protein
MKKAIVIMIMGLLVNMAGASLVLADGGDANVEQVRTSIQKLGTGQKVQVRVELRDKSTVEGYISEAGSETFSVTKLDTGKMTAVPYANVKSVKARKLGTKGKIAIIAGAAAAITLLILWKVIVDLDE